jgi:hypothetical protein
MKTRFRPFKSFDDQVTIRRGTKMGLKLLVCISITTSSSKILCGHESTMFN